MAQLPPKVPNMTPNWTDFHHQRIPSMGSLAPNTNQNPSWVDEFFDFSSVKRGCHRRSASDSITFLDAPMAEECRNTAAPAPGSRTNNVFDHEFNDERLLSMFNDEISMAVAPTMSSSNPSTPSDNNSINIDDEKHTTPDHHQQLRDESEEVQSLCKSDIQLPPYAAVTTPSDQIIDPKRVKRILANRQSAQRSRVRKLQYMSELERSVTSLQAEVSMLSPRVAFLDHQRLVLNVNNSALKQRIAALAQDNIFKDAHQEALKREIERLRQVQHQQNLEEMENHTPPPPPSSFDGNGFTEKEELLN